LRYNAWRFFKQKKVSTKQKKRKFPKFYFLLFLFKLETPKYLEVDYTTLTVFLIKLQGSQLFHSYYLGKYFSLKFFNLYNFKKIN